MKFLAMLKDSLREAIDSTVFFVMLGLSLLVVAAAATMTFTPTPGAQMLMSLCAAPLSIDPAKVDLTRAGGNTMALFSAFRGAYQVEEAAPVDGEPDLPGSTFRVVITHHENLMKWLPGNAPLGLDGVREGFGVLNEVRLAEVIDAEEVKKGTFVLHARLTADGRKWWPHSFSLFFGALPVIREGVPLGAQLFGVQNYLINQVGAWVALLMSLVMTAFFVPNMLRKGTVDLLLVKPISRSTLLLYKYAGGLLFIAINTAVAAGGCWLVLGLRSGVWAPGALVSIPAITFFFAILYSVSVLFGVMTRSAIVSILMACLTWAFLFAVSTTVTILDAFIYQAKMAKVKGGVDLLDGLGDFEPKGKGRRRGPPPLVSAEYEEGTFGRVVRLIHRVLPRTGDLNTLVSDQLQRDLLAMPRAFRNAAFRSEPVSWGESVGVSLGFIAVMMGLACWWFSTKDY